MNKVEVIMPTYTIHKLSLLKFSMEIESSMKQ